jgi:hypothetical protein
MPTSAPGCTALASTHHNSQREVRLAMPIAPYSREQKLRIAQASSLEKRALLKCVLDLCTIK